MEVTALTRLNAAEPTGPSLGTTSDGSFQEAIERATQGYEKEEVSDAAIDYSSALLPTSLVASPLPLRDRPLVKLGPAAVAAGGAPDTVLAAVRDAGDRVMSALRSATGALSVTDLTAFAPSDAGVSAGDTTAILPVATPVATVAPGDSSDAGSVAKTSPLPAIETGELLPDSTAFTQAHVASEIVSQSEEVTAMLTSGARGKDSIVDSLVEKSVAESADVKDISKESAHTSETLVSKDGAVLQSDNDGQAPHVGATPLVPLSRASGREATASGGLETYSKFETAQSSWKPLWISRAAKSISARVETSVGPITMRLERGVNGDVTDVVVPEVLRGAIERGLASDAKDLLDKDTQYKWRYVREHNEQREKPRQQESGDDNE